LACSLILKFVNEWKVGSEGYLQPYIEIVECCYVFKSIFAFKKRRKYWRFCLAESNNTGFKKIANFSAENWRKL
jgi:hypothetical protein